MPHGQSPYYTQNEKQINRGPGISQAYINVVELSGDVFKDLTSGGWRMGGSWLGSQLQEILVLFGSWSKNQTIADLTSGILPSKGGNDNP